MVGLLVGWLDASEGGVGWLVGWLVGWSGHTKPVLCGHTKRHTKPVTKKSVICTFATYLNVKKGKIEREIC